MSRTQLRLAGSALALIFVTTAVTAALAAGTDALSLTAPTTINTGADAHVTLRVGDLVTQLLTAFETILAGIATWVFARVAPPAVKMFVTQRMIDNAVHYAIAAVEGAVKNKTWDVETSNSVVGRAEAYFLSRVPKWFAPNVEVVRKLVAAELSRMQVLPPEANEKRLRLTPDNTVNKRL